ncbi:MAG: serine/threonine-protein kinase, partial [Bdellovibrionales bacterium]|nr:serine/threonine-protein kinase [Bdellovibrionales bacterium]
MAEICLAHDPGAEGMGRFVVIKRTLSQYSERAEFKDMFKTEGLVACNLKHRNIVPMYEFGIEANQFFLALEYISGRNLRELLKKLTALNADLPIQHAIYIIKEAASGLDYAHNVIDSSTGQPLNLIHRDVSPQNLMLSFDGEIKLIDFGIAKVADRNLTQVGHLKGKFGYMSPEQTRGERLDPKTDIFCLGIILWELLAGERLFQSKSEMGSLKKIRACNVPPLDRVNPRVPTKLAKIVHRALNKNRNMRHKTAAEFEKDLTIFLNSTYPELSQYDFNAFIKKIYSQDILRERETFRAYSAKLKGHMSNLKGNLLSLNVGGEEESRQEKNYTMPSIDDDPAITATKTATATMTENEELSSEYTASSAYWEGDEEETRDSPGEKKKIKETEKRVRQSPPTSKPKVGINNPLKVQKEKLNNTEGLVSSSQIISTSQTDQLSQLFSKTTLEEQPSYKTFSSRTRKTKISRPPFMGVPKSRIIFSMALFLFGSGLIGGGVWVINNIDFVAKSSLVHNIFSIVKKESSSSSGNSSPAST